MNVLLVVGKLPYVMDLLLLKYRYIKRCVRVCVVKADNFVDNRQQLMLTLNRLDVSFEVPSSKLRLFMS